MSLPQARRTRYRLLAWIVSFCFLAVITRLVWLHWIDAPRFRAEAFQARYVLQEKVCRRGEIRDSQDNLLAVSEDVWDIGVDPDTLALKDRLRYHEVATILGLLPAKVRQAFETRVRLDSAGGEHVIRWSILAREVGDETVKRVKSLGIKGIRAELKYRRNYPKGQLAAHVLGYVNKEGVAVAGIENVMNSMLEGQNGWIESERDGRHRELASIRHREVAPVDGSTVVLTINSLIQNTCEEALAVAASRYQPKGGVIIVSEPRTGRILGLANWPTFDLNRYFNLHDAPMDSQRNRAVSDVYEPGSVFKIVSIAGALEEGLITPNSIFDCSANVVPYRGRMVSLPADSHSIGTADIRQIVRESSNRGTVQVGMLYSERLGEESYYALIKSFGFGSPSGIITGAEVSGLLNPPKRWDGITISRIPMGHSVSVTAMQMHFAMSIIAADGLLMQPQLVLRVEDTKTKTTILNYAPRSRGRVISASTAETLSSMLREVCGIGGTARIADIPGFEVAGKTGTTQKLVNGHYSTSHHVASFVGFFPKSDPKLAITVIIDEPHGEGVGYGGKVAAPIFREVAEKCIRWLDLPPVTQPIRGTVANLAQQ